MRQAMQLAGPCRRLYGQFEGRQLGLAGGPAQRHRTGCRRVVKALQRTGYLGRTVYRLW